MDMQDALNYMDAIDSGRETDNKIVTVAQQLLKKASSCRQLHVLTVYYVHESMFRAVVDKDPQTLCSFMQGLFSAARWAEIIYCDFDGSIADLGREYRDAILEELRREEVNTC